MLTITLRDLQWRARRFALGILATTLVFATTLLLVGIHRSFQEESTRTVQMFGADSWVVPAGVSGPFTADAPLHESVAGRVKRARGVRAADPVVLFRQVAYDSAGEERDVNVIAYRREGVVRPDFVRGREPSKAGEVAVDDRLEVELGERLSMGRVQVRVVGFTHGITYYGGTPAMLMGLRAGQRMAFEGDPLATAIITDGVPRSSPRGLKVMSETEVRDDLRRPFSAATNTLGGLVVILWLVASGIVGMMVYLSGLDRMLDFAVFKAIGVRPRTLLRAMVLQVLLLALSSALIAAVAANVVAPLFPIDVVLEKTAYLALLAAALGVGLVASLISVRQVSRIDPALAFARN